MGRFFVSQEMTEVNMKEVTFYCVDHNIVWMTVTKTQHIWGDTIACSWSNEHLTNMLKSRLPDFFKFNTFLRI